MRENRIMPEAIQIYSVGLCFASVCTSASDDDATVLLNKEFPTGISNGWSVSSENFADGSPNPSPCPDTTGHRHVLFDC